MIRKPNELAFSLEFRHRTGETLISDVAIDSTCTSIVQLGQDYLRRDRSEPRERDRSSTSAPGC
ncbi:MAG: hypothetical protein WA949_15900 [Phormidesmis sp.]